MIKMYTLPYCGYCVNAKQLLEAEGVSYEEIDIITANISRERLSEMTGGRTVPQIVIRGKSIGGFSEMLELKRNVELEAVLNPPEAESAPAGQCPAE